MPLGVQFPVAGRSGESPAAARRGEGRQRVTFELGRLRDKTDFGHTSSPKPTIVDVTIGQ
jgi:hypothetical protein